ncbi:MAG: ATP-binding protein [Verrucomicrobiae bacterium]|nr:ATP-binding protein [Verrucomicrobiae bacterium]
MTEIVVLHELVCDELGKPLDYRILDTNPAFTQVTGIRWEQANGKLASEVYQQSPPPYLEVYARVAQSGIAEQFETYYEPMRKHFLISVFSPAPGRFATVATDITLRKEKEEEARRLSRLYATLSAVNQTVVRVQSEQDLMESSCRAIVELGGFCLAWAGKLNPPTSQVLPLAAFGLRPIKKEAIVVYADERPEGLGPSGTAIRRQRPVVSQMESDDPRLAPWRHLIEEHQIKSCAAFPLFDEGGVYGSLTVCSPSTSAFTERELALLAEVAADVTFALKRLQAERRQQQMEQILVERERQLQMLLANIPGGVYKCEVHAPWRVAFFSEGSQAITGRPPSDFTEGKLTYADMVHPDDLSELDKIVEEAVVARRAYEATYRIVRPDGQIRHVFEKGRACYDEKGTPQFLEGIVFDITAQRQAERQLQASQRELEAVHEQAPVVMMLLDEHFKIVRANRAARMLADVPAHEWNACFKGGPGDVLRCVNALTASSGCGSSVACLQCLLLHSLQELQNTTHCCSEVECQLTLAGSKQKQQVELQGNVCRLNIDGQTRFLLCLNDVTARNRAEAERDRLQQQLFQAQKMEAIGHLAGGIAHDFNNILAAMMMHYQELLEDAQLSPPVRESINELNKLAERAANLTRQLLLYSRRAPMEKKVLDLNACVMDMLKLLRRSVGEHIQVIFSPAAEPAWVNADASLLGQVLLNLAVNARDAMPKGGDLRVAVHTREILEAELSEHPQGKTGQYAVLEVSDTGCGMPLEVLARIFDPFFTTKGPGKGTGLGLATVEGIVKQHEGWIEVKSEVGIGSTFTIYLPLAKSAEAAATSQGPAPRIVGGTETILLVEDEPSVRRGISNCLRRAGYQVIEAGHGAEALQIWGLRKDEIALVFTDMVLPGGMSGLELIQIMRAEQPDLRVIFSTGYSVELAEWELSLGGIFAILPKPYTISQLTSTLREVLERPAPAK